MPHAALFVLLATLLSDAPDPSEQVNLLANSGFEQGQTAPTRWSFNHRHTDGEIAWDKTRAASGSASVRITNRNQGQSGNVVATVRFDPPLEPDSIIQFGAMAACQDLQGTGPRIVVYLEGGSAPRQTVNATDVGGTHDFVPVAGQATAKNRVDRAVVYLCNYDIGTVWWDDAEVSVRRAPPVKVLARSETSKRLPPLVTSDGLELVLDAAGGVESVRLDGSRAPQFPSQSGWWLKPFQGDVLPVAGEITVGDGSLRQRFESEAAGLRVDVAFRLHGDVIRCRGWIEDLTSDDRGVEVWFSLPVGTPAWRWGQSIREEIPLADGPHRQDSTTFSSVSSPESGQGVALSVPADCPCDCAFTHDDTFGYAVRFRLGLSQATGGQLKGRAPLAFDLYRCDGRWGLRDAARRYYQLWPEAFATRAEREGLWLFGSPRFELPDIENYAFHEGGPAGWEEDEAHGVYTCPYIIPGQREIKGLDKLPASNREAKEILRTFEPSKDTPARESRGWGTTIKPIIENSALVDAQGETYMRIRHTFWGGNSITFPLNASPRLLADTDEPTVAKALLAYCDAMFQEIPDLDGIYVDSLGAWGDYINYRREHFACTQVPPSFDMATGRPMIPNRFTLLEFLWELRDRLHTQDRLLFANGLHPNRRFHAFALDVMGVEGHGSLEQKRTIAYRKPFLLLIYNIHDDPAAMEHYFHLATFYGIYPSFASMRVYETPEMYAPTAALNNRFVPVLRTITGAGWEPVTRARSSRPDVWLERWGPGPDGTVYLTVYNTCEEESTVTLSIEAAELGLRGTAVRASDLLSDATWEAPVDEGGVSFNMTVPPEQVRVLKLSGQRNGAGT